MSLKLLVPGETVEHTDLNAVVADLPVTMLVGMRSENSVVTASRTSYSSTPDLVLHIAPVLGPYMEIKVGIRVDSLGTSYVKAEIWEEGAGSGDQVFEANTTSMTRVTLRGLATVTGLTNTGDAVGKTCYLKLFVRNTNGSPTHIEGVSIITGNSSSSGDYLT